MTIRTKWAAIAMSGFAALYATFAAAQTRFDHHAPGYVVPEKRVQISANVTDPKGVKLARVYFKTPAQADYVFVPMSSAGGARYVATVPAINASAPSLQYVLLAVSSEGAVSKTQEYTVAARKSTEVPAWQSASNTGEMKVFTEAAMAPQSVAGFADSIAMDVVESGARFGAAAGLAASGGAGAAGSGAAGGTSAGATAGGLSTAAIVGGVAIAAGVAAAAGGGGGGGGGGGSTTGGGLSGSWSGTVTQNIQMSCTVPGASATETCTLSQPFTGTVDGSGNFNYTAAASTMNCSLSGSSFSQPVPASSSSFNVPSSGNVTIPGSTNSQSGITTVCPAGSITFANSPRRISGSYTCNTSGSPSPGSTCNGTSVVTWSGS